MYKKMTNDKPSVTLMIPMYNSAQMLPETFRALEMQDYPICKVILVDDCSKDKSLDIAKKYKKQSKFNVSIVAHAENRGLSVRYNEIIRSLHTTLFITLNADCVIIGRNGVRRLIEPFRKNSLVVESCSWQRYPDRFWKKYNFWQKCLLARRIGKTMSGRNSSFCCFSVSALRTIGMFDTETFRTAGEDADIIARLEKAGKIVDADCIIDHSYPINSRFSLRDLLHKEHQLAEAEGAALSKHMLFSFNTLKLFIRPFIIFLLFFPHIRVFSVLMIVIFTFLYTMRVYSEEWKNPRILLLPLINSLLLVTHSYYFLRGFLTGKQRI